MQHQANASQRRLQFVTDRGHQVALDLIEEAKAGHVVEYESRAQCTTEGILNGQNLRQVGAILAVVTKRDGLVERLRQERALLVQGVVQRLAQRGGRHPVVGRRLAGRWRSDPQQSMRGGVGHLDAAIRIEYQHRIGERIDGRLTGALHAQEMRGVRVAVAAQLPAHAIECLGQLPHLVVGDDGHHLIEIAGPDGDGRLRDGLDRSQDRARCTPNQQAGEQGRHRQGDNQPDLRDGRGVQRLAAGLLHVALIQFADRARHGLDVAETLQ
jgi:hypothetical protein